METKHHNFIGMLNRLSKTGWMIVFSIIITVILGAVAMLYISNDNSMSLSADDRIDVTPTQIQSIREIGQWEFLAISNEEIVDTVRHGFFGDAQLARIYYGTLRLGIDLHEAEDRFIQTKGDSVIVQLPPVKLLDHSFIDEARTKSFFEKGDWTAKDRDDMYHRAYQAMINRCMTARNIATAERNAAQQFYKLMKSMGFDNVIIRHTPYASKGSKKKRS